MDSRSVPDDFPYVLLDTKVIKYEWSGVCFNGLPVTPQILGNKEMRK
jgi:hypothetical protein